MTPAPMIRQMVMPAAMPNQIYGHVRIVEYMAEGTVYGTARNVAHLTNEPFAYLRILLWSQGLLEEG